MKKFLLLMAAIFAFGNESKTDVIVGDEDFLKKSDLKITEYVNLGSGALVLATKKGVKIEKIDELKTLSKIAMPDAAKTVYGKRASEFMQNANLEGELKDKILAVAGVPQVVTYILNG